MIKELLILLLLYEISNGQQSTNQLTDFEHCTNDKNAVKLGLPWNICVPSKNASWIQWLRPKRRLSPKRKTKLRINIANLQVIQIESHAITLSMDTVMYWYENRLVLNVPKFQTAFIRPEEEGKIWSPEIHIANNKMFENKEREEFGFTKFYKERDSVTGMKKFYLYTKLTCVMDFENFPFDKQVCNLEVSCYHLKIQEKSFRLFA